MTTAEFFRSWLSNTEKNVSPRTFEGYKAIMTQHLIPVLGNIPLRKLKPLHIQAHYAACLRDDARKDGREGGLSARTVLHHHRLLYQSLEDAVAWEYIGRNPARAAKPPRIEDREVTVLDAAQTTWLIECAKGTRLSIPIQLAVVFLGLRRGEVLGCRWSDINWPAKEIFIQRAVEETKALGVRMKSPKSKRGKRWLSIPELLMQALRETKAAASPADDAFICQGMTARYGGPRPSRRAIAIWWPGGDSRDRPTSICCGMVTAPSSRERK